MRSVHGLIFSVVLSAAVGGCDFSPGAAAPLGGGANSGTGDSAGAGASNGTGAAGNGGSNGTGVGLTGGDVGVGGGGGTGTTCGQTNVSIQTLPPDILIVQDRSGSMDDDKNDKTCNGGCGANSKWALVTAAINQVVGMTDTTVNWGLKFFADTDNVCGVGNGVAAPVAPMSAPAIATAIAGSTKANGGVNNGSHTPTRLAVNAGVTYLNTLTDSNPKYLLLATDGLPNCVPGGSENADDSAGTEQAVADAATAGFLTFVVGISTTSDAMATATLNAMATNGGEAQTGAATSYYSVTDTASLVTALDKIVGIVASCTLPLQGAPTNFNNVAVSVDTGSGTIAVPQDATNGWSYTANMTSVVFNGTACDSLKSGAYNNVQFIYACPGTQIMIGSVVGR